MKHTLIARRIGLAASLVTFAACVDLTRPNNNDPNRLNATATPGDVEAIIASTFQLWWPRVYGTTPTVMWSAMGYEISTPFLCFSSQEMSQEPRPAWNNTTIYVRSNTSSGPWLDLYGVISLTNDGLKALDRGLNIGVNGAGNARARAFAKFMQGVAHGYLALQFDKALVLDEHADVDTLVTPTYVPYTEVMTAAIGMLKESIAISDTATFTLPTTGWVPGLALTNQDLSRLAHTYIARFETYVARTAAERAAVNWSDVIAHIDAGITTDFAPIGSPTGLVDNGKRLFARSNSFPGDQQRASNWLIGPSDSLDGFKNWVATPVANRNPFQVQTADRRIQGPTVGSAGAYFGYEANVSWMNPTRGLYLRSFYYFKRFGTGTTWQSGPLMALTRTELNLIKAEALIRLNRAAEAVPLINATRVANGKLPPVDLNGPPDQAGCVPRKTSGACGGLWDALRYEKRIEQAGVDGQVAFYDARGWNTLAVNSFLELPIPGRELEIQRLPNYTYGGGGARSAPQPQWDKCPTGVSLSKCG
ncbi:MAG TPA: hypothetical protein VIP11_21635 [Gemmatimonadaceae bacterium]